MRKMALLATSCLLAFSLSAVAQEADVKIPPWQEGQETGGWGGLYNSTIANDQEGVLLKAGLENYYGSAFRALGEVDLDRCPFFVVEVDKAEGSFGCKLINEAKKDKQVILEPSPGDRCYLSHLPSQTGWTGKVPLSIGIYCHGAGKSLCVRSIRFVTNPTKDLMDRYDQVRNLLADSSFELDAPERPPIQVWHRLGSYLREETPWTVAAGDAFHGKQCARTLKPGKLVIQREIHGPGQGMYVLTAYLKAAKEGHKAKLSVTLYQQGRPFTTSTESQNIAVGAEWARHEMAIDVPTVRNRDQLGPVDIAVESLDEGELRLDAMQLELAKKPTLYGPNRTLDTCARLSDLRSPLYQALKEPLGPPAPPACASGTIPLRPLEGGPPPALGWPIIGTVTLPQGVSYDAVLWRLKNPDGKCIPIQTRVLARWKGDGSIKGAQVAAQADGATEWTIEYNSNAPMPLAMITPELKQPEPTVQAKGFTITSVEGKAFESQETTALTRFEEDGPIHAIVRAEGAHRSADGGELMSFVCRRHSYRCPNSTAPRLTRTEYTWINTNAAPTAIVSSIACRIPLDAKQTKGLSFFGADGKAIAVDPAKGGSLLQCDEKGKYFHEVRMGDGAPQRFEGKAEGRVRVDLGETIAEVLVGDWWQNHPMEIAASGQSVTIYFWSPRVKAAELTQGMAKTYVVDIWHGPKGEVPQRMSGPVQLVAPTRVHCRSGVFGGVMLPSEGSPFPIFEKAVNNPVCLARMNPDLVLATDSFGQFNYGDCMGDGGWANLETQRGHSAWLHYFRTGNPKMFEVARAAARHYRDIDIDQISGSTITHNPSHTLGGKSTSHAWIQSMLDHYLATGEHRSMEVALLHADFLVKVPPRKLAHGGREVTRVLDNLADLYMLTGEESLVQRYHEVVAVLRENLRGKTKFPGVFQHEMNNQWTYPAGFPPWYGLYSMVKMRLATGDKGWEKALEEEIGYALAKTPFEYAWPEYFKDNRLIDDQRIVRCMAEGAIGDRGCMLFPPVGYAYRWTQDKRYLYLGMATTYIALISREYQDPLYALAGVFLEQAREAGLGAADERRFYQEAIDIMKGASRPALSNPGFEEGRKDWKAWSAKSTTSSFWAPVRDKCLLPDPAMKKEGAQSLHVVVRRDCPPWGSGVPLDSEFFIMEKGKSYVLEGWVRTTGAVSPSVAMTLRPLSPDVDPKPFTGVIEKADADGWRRWRLEAVAEADSLACLSLNIGRANAKSEGDGWWDGITVNATK